MAYTTLADVKEYLSIPTGTTSKEIITSLIRKINPDFSVRAVFYLAGVPLDDDCLERILFF